MEVGDETEMVQVWVNIRKNKEAGVSNFTCGRLPFSLLLLYFAKSGVRIDHTLSKSLFLGKGFQMSSEMHEISKQSHVTAKAVYVVVPRSPLVLFWAYSTISSGDLQVRPCSLLHSSDPHLTFFIDSLEEHPSP